MMHDTLMNEYKDSTDKLIADVDLDAGENGDLEKLENFCCRLQELLAATVAEHMVVRPCVQRTAFEVDFTFTASKT